VTGAFDKTPASRVKDCSGILFLTIEKKKIQRKSLMLCVAMKEVGIDGFKNHVIARNFFWEI
jgi:hypothetical protein